MMKTTHRKKYRIKSRVRFTMFIICSMILVLLITAATTTILGFNDADGMSKQQYIQVQVEPGDTLWAIADRYMPSDMDRRESVYIISTANNTTASELQPGQILDIPVK